MLSPFNQAAVRPHHAAVGRDGRSGSALGRLLRILALVLVLPWQAQAMSLASGIQTACHWLPDCPWFWDSFLDCANVLQGWAGRGLPECVVPSRVLSYVEGRAPSHPILLAHSPDDRDVPGDGAVEALEILAKAVRQEGRDPSGLLELRHLGEPGEGVGHICAFVPGVVTALRQIEAWRAQ